MASAVNHQLAFDLRRLRLYNFIKFAIVSWTTVSKLKLSFTLNTFFCLRKHRAEMHTINLLFYYCIVTALECLIIIMRCDYYLSQLVCGSLLNPHGYVLQF